jgi:hypothetical protein
LPAQLARLRADLPEIRARVALLGLRIRGSAEYVARLEFAAQGIGVAVDDCDPGQHFLFIEERGLISPCSFTTDGYGIPISDIHTARDLADLPRRFAHRQTSHRHPACNNCLSTQVFGKFNSS